MRLRIPNFITLYSAHAKFSRMLQLRRFLTRNLRYPWRNHDYQPSQLMSALVYPIILRLKETRSQREPGVILLDTNVVSEPMRSNPDRSVVTWLDAQSVESLYLATLSLSELLLGIASLPAGKRRSALAGALDEQIISLFAERIVPFDVAGAEAYAEIVTRARRHGHSIADAQDDGHCSIPSFHPSYTRRRSFPSPWHHGHRYDW